MKKSRWFVILAVLLLASLAACGGTANSDAVQGSADSQASSGGAQSAARTRLQDGFNGALTIQGQLAAGTLLLEDTDMAVDDALAAELLPLWQAVQSLSSSDTAAAVEIQAVLNQIQDTMAPEQVAAIADMELTEDSLASLLEEGALAIGFGRGQGQADEEGSTAFPGGGFPGGGVPGGGPGGGGFPGGGPGRGGAGGVDPQALATRQAEFAGQDASSLQERGLTGAVVRLLGTKSGEFSVDERVLIFDEVFGVVSEATGLDIQEIQSQTAEGLTLAEIVEANGGDVEAVRAALLQALNELPNAEDLDPQALATQWLGLEP